MDFHVIIPARFASSRLPGKVLMDIHGKSMLQHVYERAVASDAQSVTIATEDEQVAIAAEAFGADVCMTSSDHSSGTERLSEAAEALELEKDDIVICVQGDEPLIPPNTIRDIAADLFEYVNVKVSSLCEPIEDVEDFFDPNVVKVVLNRRHHAVYFSRACIPFDRDQFAGERDKIQLIDPCYRHVGIYGYRAGFLQDYMNWAPCPLEKMEKLEQLRILFNGGRIYMRVLKKPMPLGVNTQKDLDRVRSLVKK